MNDKSLDNLFSDLRTIYHDIKLISTDMIAVADWVRLKCRYGCRTYGKHLCCRLYGPDTRGDEEGGC